MSPLNVPLQDELRIQRPHGCANLLASFAIIMQSLGIINRSHALVTGPFINASAVLLGGVLGALLKSKIAGTVLYINDLYFWALASLGIKFYW